jgi:hypothetical protein
VRTCASCICFQPLLHSTVGSSSAHAALFCLRMCPV